MISPTTIDILNSLSLVEVIGHYTKLTKKGTSHTGCCPFHDEKTPSFSVSETKYNGIYKCFGCGKGGNRPINFVMEVANLPFVQACEELANKTGTTIEYERYDSDEYKAKAEQKADYYKINEAAAIRYAKQLPDINPTHPANKMLFDRWATIATHEQIIELVTKWQIGYAPDSWDFMTKSVNEKALTESALTLGLIHHKNGKHFDTYRHRLMFPIHNNNGQIVGFGGRDLPPMPGKEATKTAKYINSSDSEIYNKSQTLYGLYHAKKAIQDQGFVYLTEGYTDVISFHLAGLSNTVATCGTALTAEQATILKRYTSCVVLAYDGDKAGKAAIFKAMDVLIPLGFDVHVLALPEGQDPDSFATHYPAYAWAHGTFEYKIIDLQTDSIDYKAWHLLEGVDNPAARNNGFNDMARTLAMFDESRKAMRSDYGRRIAKNYKMDWSTLRGLIDDQLKVKEIQEVKIKKVRKNKTAKLNGNVNQFPFFEEQTDKKGNFTDIKINKVKFVELLSHFGFTRYDVSDNNDYTFVRLEENIIQDVKKDEIIDFVEHYLEQKYDFEGAGLLYADAEMIRNKFYDGMRSYFSKDLFARMRLEQPIIINKDDKEHTYFYYENGFVAITADGWKLHPYEEMNGSVWNNQMLDRPFVNLYENLYSKEDDFDISELGVFADFVYRLSGAYRAETATDATKKAEYFKRFYSLCTIIGYVIHDFYQYKLKAILLTDSSLSDESDGRTGKTLLGKLIGHIRSYCEINGKDFDANNKNKYEAAKLGTQVLHLNDVKNKGRYKFDFEDVFNDVTEGYTVDAKYMQPFKGMSKMILSTNKTLNISGGSQRDRIIQFEVSDFFNEKHSPADFYGHWLMLDWKADEWQKFDNFMCYCASLHHSKGIIEPSTINLEMRVLKDHTCQEFIDFMADISHSLKEKKIPYQGYNMPDAAGMFDKSIEHTMSTFEFEKKQLYLKFKEDFEDYKNANWFTQQHFTKWLKMYSKYVMGVDKPITRRSNSKDLIIFRNE